MVGFRPSRAPVRRRALVAFAGTSLSIAANRAAGGDGLVAAGQAFAAGLQVGRVSTRGDLGAIVDGVGAESGPVRVVTDARSIPVGGSIVRAAEGTAGGLSSGLVWATHLGCGDVGGSPIGSGPFSGMIQAGEIGRLVVGGRPSVKPPDPAASGPRPRSDR